MRKRHCRVQEKAQGSTDLVAGWAVDGATMFCDRISPCSSLGCYIDQAGPKLIEILLPQLSKC